jgi:hypothetical protein
MTGAQFEIRIDHTPRTYRDRKDFAMDAASFLKSRNPRCVVTYQLGAPSDQFIHDECERNCHVSGDGKRIGIDDKRPCSIRTAGCNRNLLTKINNVTVKHHGPFSIDVVGPDN